jgi:hypothetical protein
LAASSDTLYCSFCGKSQREVKKLIAGPTVFICHECVDLCADICRGNDALDEDAAAAAAEWSRRSAALRQAIDALSSQHEDAIEPIRGLWVMTASHDTADGSVRIVLKRNSPDDGDISIAFTETAEDLADIAAWVAAAKEGGPRAEPAHARINEGIEIALWMSGKALLREYERRSELLNLGELLQPKQTPLEQALPTDMMHLRDAVSSIIERNPEQRQAIAGVLREMLNKLAYTR